MYAIISHNYYLQVIAILTELLFHGYLLSTFVWEKYKILSEIRYNYDAWNLQHIFREFEFPASFSSSVISRR